MEQTANLIPQEDEVTKEVATVEVQANALKVIDTASYLAAGDLWKSIKALRAKVADTFDDIISAAHLAHKKAIEKKKMHDDPLNAAERIVKKEMERFDAEQERIRKAEEERLAAIARKEEEERRRIEQERLEAERKAEEERLLKEAEAAKLRGDKETADALLNAAVESNEQINQAAAAIAAEPIYVPPVVVPKSVPKMAGGPVYREMWLAEVTDIKALCLAVATGKASTECVLGNMPTLNRMAVALKGTMNIPGVRSYSKRV